MPFQAIFFDLDGTIIDTEPVAARAVVRCFQGWGLPIGKDDAAFVTGRTWNSAMQYFMSKYTLPLPEAESLQAMLEAYRTELEENLPVVEGSVATIRDLCAEYPLALISGSNRKDILWALEKLAIRDCFKIVLGAEDYPRSKPAPDGYLKAAEQLKVRGSDCLIFEDSTPGIESARAAGARVVAITSTNHFAQSQVLAHHSIPNFKGIDADWVRKISSES